jgi:hypothetical protein
LILKASDDSEVLCPPCNIGIIPNTVLLFKQPQKQNNYEGSHTHESNLLEDILMINTTHLKARHAAILEITPHKILTPSNMNGRVFKPIPTPDFEIKCHFTSQILSCNHKEFLKKPRVVHVWPCPSPNGTKRSCLNMATKPKEVLVEGLCSKCQLAADELDKASITPDEVDKVGIAAGGGDETKVSDYWSASWDGQKWVRLRGKERIPITARKTPEFSQNQNVPKNEESDTPAPVQGERIPRLEIGHVETRRGEDGNSARKRSMDGSWIDVQIESSTELLVKAKKEEPEWEFVDEDEVTGHGWGNGKTEKQCRVN